MTKLDDPEWLHDAYVAKGMSTTEIAKLVNRSARLVSMKLKKHGIPARTASQAALKKSKEISERTRNRWREEEYRKKVTESVRDAYRNDELRTRCRTASTEHWQSEDSRIKASTASRKAWKESGKDRRETASRNARKNAPSAEETRARWQDGAYRRKVSEGVRKVCEDSAWREEASARSTRLWADEAYRSKVSKSLEKARRKPEYAHRLALGRLRQERTSYEERVLSAILKEAGIGSRKVVIGPHEFDLQVDVDPPLLIEVQGEYWHPPGRPHDAAKRTYFQRYLSDRYRLMYVHDYEFMAEGLIVQRLREAGIDLTVRRISARQLSFRTVEAELYRDFYARYHYIGNRGRWGFSVGGFMDDRLVCCVTYAGCTRKEAATRLGARPSEVRELVRLCRHPLYRCRNMLSRLIAESIRMVRAERPGLKWLISYADGDRGHSGTVYRASGWQKDGTVRSSYCYMKDGCSVHKKTMWDRARRMGTSESEYSVAHGFRKVLCGSKTRYVLDLSTRRQPAS